VSQDRPRLLAPNTPNAPNAAIWCNLPGDANPSVQRAPLAPPASCAAWLDELLAQLSDRPAHLVGQSYGGWVAMNQALRASGRVASITLLDPAGLTKLDARFYRWMTVSDRASLMPHAEVAVVPGSHGGFNRIGELNDRIVAFIKDQAAGKRSAQPAQPRASRGGRT
jgi:pimeloyl-ACP methyl ester carboxylesterase